MHFFPQQIIKINQNKCYKETQTKKIKKSEIVGKNGPVPSSNSQIMSRGHSIAGDKKTNFHLSP